MPNYQNGKVYSIRSRSRPDLVYVGSTTQSLSVRFGGHKTPKYEKYTSKQIIDLGDAYIELIENYSCNSREELVRREGQIIRSMDCVNKVIAGRTVSEWRRDNSDTIKDNAKQYRIDNADTLLEKHRQYNKDNADKIKQYNKDNADRINQKTNQYYHDNADTISEKNKRKIKCRFCDKMIRKGNIPRHEKTTNHIQNYINY